MMAVPGSLLKHHLSLHEMEPQDKCKGGYRIRATKSSFPALQGMSFYKLVIYPRSVREPHWHANADELGYCLKGSLLISFYGNRNLKESFVVSEGDAFFIPSGAFHSIENIGDDTAEILLQFSHEEPEDFELSFVFGIFSDAVLGNTWNVSSKQFQELNRGSKKTFIVKLEQPTLISKEARYASPYRYRLEESSPLLSNKGGNAKVARQNVWPILQKQSLYSLHLMGQGMREPHWHPETAEMGYVAEGRARMSIISPSGKVDTYRLEKGDIYFIPKAYPHHIENLEGTELHMLIFFDQSMPQDIGFTGSIKSFSIDVLSSTMDCKKDLFASLPTYYEDLFIVEKKNSLDK
jgi:oxalate decarboxylase